MHVIIIRAVLFSFLFTTYSETKGTQMKHYRLLIKDMKIIMCLSMT